MDLRLRATHANMTLVDFKIFIRPSRLIVLEFVFAELNVNSIERFILILMREVNPSRNTVFIIAISEFHLAFDL